MPYYDFMKRVVFLIVTAYFGFSSIYEFGHKTVFPLGASERRESYFK